MSNTKKRKTRDQKERAAQRRSQRTYTSSSQANHPASKPTGNETTSSQTSRMESVSPKQDTPTEEHARHAERVRLMKISVMVFAGLVVFQLTLWGLDYIGAISLSAA